MSVRPSAADIDQGNDLVSFLPILLQKSFWGDERKFLEPLMRFTSGDVRDHIVSSKIDHGPPEAVFPLSMANHWLRTGPNGREDPLARMIRAPRISAQRLQRDRLRHGILAPRRNRNVT
jgi:hypothetical protein